MKKIPSDYEPPDTEFEPFKDGKYSAVGFTWFTLAEDRPILAAQKDGRMVARLRFVLEGEEGGPPFSVTLRQVPGLVYAFGVPIQELPSMPRLDQPAKISGYLEAAQGLVSKATKAVGVTVDRGWVQTVVGMDVPAGYYYLRLFDLSPKDENGDPYTRSGQYGPFFFADFEVVSGEGGSSTPWAGSTFRELVNYALDVETKEGRTRPVWQTTEGGKIKASAVRLGRLMEYTAPALFEQEEYPFSDPHNILPEWFRLAADAKALLRGSRIKPEGKTGIRLSWPTLEPGTLATTAAPVVAPSASSEPTASEDLRVQALAIFRRMFEALGGDVQVFAGDDLSLTKDGKGVARMYIGPAKKAGLVKSKLIRKLSIEEMGNIGKFLEEEEAVDKVIPFRKELIALLKGGDDVEEDF